MEDILNHSASMESRRTPNTQQVFRSIVEGRKKWKDLQPKGENIWSPDFEAALLEGLEKYRPDESRETKLLGRFPARNRFIADFIYQKTGRRRTPKQVGSRLQQLRDTVGDKKLLQLFCPYWHANSMQTKATFDHLSDGLADSVGYADRTKLGLSAFNVDDFSQVEMPNKSTVERVLEFLEREKSGRRSKRQKCFDHRPVVAEIDVRPGGHPPLISRWYNKTFLSPARLNMCNNLVPNGNGLVSDSESELIQVASVLDFESHKTAKDESSFMAAMQLPDGKVTVHTAFDGSDRATHGSETLMSMLSDIGKTRNVGDEGYRADVERLQASVTGPELTNCIL